MSNYMRGRTRSGRIYQPAYTAAQPATTSQPGPPQPPPQPPPPLPQPQQSPAPQPPLQQPPQQPSPPEQQPPPQQLPLPPPQLSPQPPTIAAQDIDVLSVTSTDPASTNSQTPHLQTPSLVTHMDSERGPNIGSDAVANNGDTSVWTYLVQCAYQVFHHVTQDLRCVCFDPWTWLLFIPLAILVIFTSLCLRWEVACQADPLDLWWQFCSQKFQATILSVYFYVAIMRHCRDAIRGVHGTLVHAEAVTTRYAQVPGHISDALFRMELSKLTLYGAAHILRPILAITVPVFFESQSIFGEAGFPLTTVYSHIYLTITSWILVGIVYVFVAHADQPREMQRLVPLWYVCNLACCLILRYLR